MKQWLFIIVFILLAATVTAQDQVKWEYHTVKKSNGIFEIRIEAVLQRGWHIYSQSTPEGGPAPIKIYFNSNPLLALEGGVVEYGKKEEKYEEVFEVDTEYYSNRVEFVQLVRLKKNAKTNIHGTVEFMICSEQQCFPPTKKTFMLHLN